MEPEPWTHLGGSAAGASAAFPSVPQPREQERKLQQEKLSGVVKSVHRRLRKKYREGFTVRLMEKLGIYQKDTPSSHYQTRPSALPA